MRILREPNFDFLKYRVLWIAISMATIAGGLVGIFFLDTLNFGVDFAGGTQLTVKFKEPVEIQKLRDLVADAGFKEAVIQRFGQEGDNEVMVRTPLTEGSEEGSARKVSAALDARFGQKPGAFDLNQVGSLTISQTLAAANPDGVAADAVQSHYRGVAESIMAKRKELGLFTSWEQVASAQGPSPRVLDQLRANGTLGAFSVLGVENVGPQVGAELRRQGILAVAGAMIGMLIYIWIRFELFFGVGATMATLHDVLITLGIFAWAGYEFNLTTVAAFLTLIGYSVNDTVVTFDRVRENLRKQRSVDLLTTLNKSINQTLSRTLLTGGMVIMVSICLFFLGGDVIHGFAFVMFVGVIVGTYSSIYIASPFALLWEQWFGPGGRFRRGGAAASPAKR